MIADAVAADGVPQTAGRSLRVVQVVRSDAFSGVERYIGQVADELASRGHQVVVIGGDPARMRSELSDPVTHVPATTVGQTVRALLGHRHVDVVHAHMTAAETAAWLAHPIQRAPMVATRHFAGHRGSTGPARALASVITRSLALDIAISQFVADTIEGPSVLLWNGVVDQDQAPLESPTVVMLQRLNREKDPQLGVRAFAESGLASKGWRLVVAGRGDLEASLVTSARHLGLTDHVSFVGHVADTAGLLAASSVLLAPAPLEPFGLSVVEAMAHGVPVVAAGGGGHLETVGEDGLLFPPGDAAAGGRALAELGASRDRRVEVGGALRDKQQRQFSLAVHVDRLELLYAEVIAGRRAGDGSPLS